MTPRRASGRLARPARGAVLRSSAALLCGAALSLCPGAGCRSPRGGDSPAPGLLEALLALAEEAAAERLVPAPPPAGVTRRRLEALVRDVRAELPGARHPVEAINTVLFARRGFARVVDKPDLSLSLLPQVLQSKRGSCAGLAAVYLALGEQLKLPLGAVLLPGHLLLRYDPGGPQERNVELLKGGQAMEAAWYRQRYGPPPKSALYWRRTLADAELLAVLRYNLANALRRAGRLRGALVSYRHVTAQLPGFAEAQANLGAVLQALGQLELAAQAYEQAQRAHPSLPGLEQNLAELRATRASQRLSGGL